ncbi:uncharacterized protein LOC123516122 [Portunus trituberculatus]|uniref:uncharacterized protein LOC123516122 n=1 Tax=Portunus trituberculatus TaxID=210409 RepID=UPI001E1CE2B0|nr:uncharacterized protein LOC123516122 [Portunus trituberculatus]
MIVLVIVSIFFLFGFLWPLMQEMERRDALLLNATLSNNATQFVSEAWLRTGGMLANATEDELKGAARPMQPDWSLVLGTFHHIKDENFEEFLIAAGLSFFTRTIILNTSPSVTFERVFQDDDDYYDLPSDNYPNVKYLDGEGGGGDWEYQKDKKFQMVLTTSSLVTLKQRFRLGHPFTKQDFDGTPSKNTVTFVAPNVLYHFKEKENVNTSIYHNFDKEGLITTIISGRTGMQARRHFHRGDDD